MLDRITVALFTAALTVLAFGVGTARANPIPDRIGGAFPVGRSDSTVAVSADRTLGITTWYPARDRGTAHYLAPDLITESGFAAQIGLAMKSPALAVQLAGRTVAAKQDAAWDLYKLPVVIVSPGFGMPREFMSIIASSLASQGYVAITVSHTGDAMVSRIGTELRPQAIEPLTAEFFDRNIELRVDDLRAVLDALPHLPFGDHLDLDRIATLGHSYGGYAAVETMFGDPRIRAAISLDGNLGLPGTKPSLSSTYGLDRPALVIGNDGIDKTWDTAATASMVKPTVVRMPEVAHMQFSDLCAVGRAGLSPEVCGDIDPTHVVVRSVRDFLTEHLR